MTTDTLKLKAVEGDVLTLRGAYLRAVRNRLAGLQRELEHLGRRKADLEAEGLNGHDAGTRREIETIEARQRQAVRTLEGLRADIERYGGEGPPERPCDKQGP